MTDSFCEGDDCCVVTSSVLKETELCNSLLEDLPLITAGALLTCFNNPVTFGVVVSWPIFCDLTAGFFLGTLNDFSLDFVPILCFPLETSETSELLLLLLAPGGTWLLLAGWAREVAFLPATLGAVVCLS